MIKRIDIEVMTPDNAKIMRRFRIKPPAKLIHRGVETAETNDYRLKQIFTPNGADEALERFIGQFDTMNPGNRYRLITLNPEGHVRKYRLVWESEAEINLNKAEELKHPGIAKGTLPALFENQNSEK